MSYRDWEEVEIDDMGNCAWYCPCGHSISHIEYLNEECMECEEEYENQEEYQYSSLITRNKI